MHVRHVCCNIIHVASSLTTFQVKPQFQEILRLSEENVGKSTCTCVSRRCGSIRFLQLRQESVGGWSSDADTVDVNKLFGVSYGCSPSLFVPDMLL